MDERKFRELLDKCLEGAAVPEEESRVIAAAEASPALQEILLRTVSFDAALRSLSHDPDAFARRILAIVSHEESSSRFARAMRHKLERERSRRRAGARRRVSAWGWAALFTGIAAAALLVSLMPRSPRPSPSAAEARRDAPRIEAPETPPPPPVRRESPPATREAPAPPSRPEATRPEGPPAAPPLRPPEPASAPPPPPAAPRPEPPAPKATVGTIALLERLEGEVFVLEKEIRNPARAGHAFLPGQGLHARGTQSCAEVKYPDGTRLLLEPDTLLAELSVRDGKRVSLGLGVLSVKVTRQPANKPLVVATPHAEFKVLGTEFTLRVGPDATRLEVAEGRVRLTRLEDGAGVEVGADHYAVVSRGLTLGPRPIPRPLLAEDFQSPQAFSARWTTTTSGPADRTALADGALRMTLSNDRNSWEDWYAATRGLFPLGSLRVTARMRLSDEAGTLLGALSAYDEADNGKGDRDHLELFLSRGSATLRTLRYAGAGSKNSQNIVSVEARRDRLWSAGQWVSLELAFDAQDVTATVNGIRLYGGPHKIANLRRVRIGLLGGLKSSAGPHAVEFDDIRVEPGR